MDLTASDIARHYSSTMDSVNFLNQTKPSYLSDEEWADALKRNKEHIKIMLDKDFWTTEDLTPFEDAIK
jgi:hypothetical protein